MGLTPRYNKQDVERLLAGGVMQIETGIVRILQYLGEQFVSEARQGLNISGAFGKGDYTDRTGNLRSSIGYFVLSQGAIIAQNLQGDSTGMAAARRALESVPKGGYQLVGVAGMDYASYVESKGYNVITSQEDSVLVDLGKMLKEFQEKINKKGVGLGYDISGPLITTMFR